MKKATKYTYIFHRVLMSLILALSIAGAIVNRDASVKSIYVFDAVQSFLFLLVSFTPTILKKLHFEIPDLAYVVFVIFMSAHFFLGEICGFFAKLSWWDSLLHTFSGFLLTFISYSIIALMNETKNKNFKLNIYFSALFAFSLTVTIGVLWEIIEFTSDSLFGSNMQRAYESVVNSTRGEAFLGQEALLDTMKDLILDAIGSLCACIVCILLYKFKKIDVGNMKLIKRNNPKLQNKVVAQNEEQVTEQNADTKVEETIETLDKENANFSENYPKKDKNSNKKLVKRKERGKNIKTFEPKDKNL